VNPALYLIDTSGLFRILQDKLRQAWADQLAAGVIAACPIVELEFLYSARSLADRLEKRRLLREVFGWVAMSDRAYERADEVQQDPSICSLPRPPNVRASSSCATTAISRRWPQLPASR
jgi:predicted nucleic acid-binding protein